jgi:outer membrane protein assembly factor BamB
MSASKVFLGVHGEVLALDRTTGQTVWRTKLSGGDFVNLLLDQDRIIATTKGEAYCVDAATGQLLWHNKLPGVGWGLITIATASGSTSAGPPYQKKRQDDAAATTSTIVASG